MITPENKIPVDDSENSETEDQQSQKDVHSNGLDNTNLPSEVDEPDTEMLKQAYDSSTPSYTLDVEKGINKKDS